MLDRLGIAVLAALVLAACEPKAPELEGGPSLDGGSTDASDTPGGLAGAPPTADLAAPILPGVIGLVPRAGMQAINACETVIAADYTNPPAMTCLLFQTEDFVEGKLTAGFLDGMSEAGWTYLRSQGSEHYFERPHPGDDCADLAAVSVVGDRLQAVLDHAGAGKPPAGAVWQAYAIPHSTRETCGADRMKP
jgi:hypothetical protein